MLVSIMAEVFYNFRPVKVYGLKAAFFGKSLLQNNTEYLTTQKLLSHYSFSPPSLQSSSPSHPPEIRRLSRLNQSIPPSIQNKLGICQKKLCRQKL